MATDLGSSLKGIAPLMANDLIIGAGHRSQSRRMTSADNDQALFDAWLKVKRSAHTRRAYQRIGRDFLAGVDKPLRSITVEDVEDYWAQWAKHSNATQAQAVAVVKSLLARAHKVGYIPFNAAAIADAPVTRGDDTIAERILERPDIEALFAAAINERDRMMFKTIYMAGLRVSEAVALRWKHVTKLKSGEIRLTIHGKGNKKRTLRLPVRFSAELLAFRCSALEDEPIFKSQKPGYRKSGHPLSLSPQAVNDAIKRAARRAQITDKVSCHWLRHSHATHAIDAGAPLHVLKAGLGHRSIQTTSVYLHADGKQSPAMYLEKAEAA